MGRRRIHEMASKGFSAAVVDAYRSGRPEYSAAMLGAAASLLAQGVGKERQPRPLRVVDVGAGTGKCLKAMAASLSAAEAGPLELHAVEPTGLASGITDAVPELPASNVHACDATALPFSSGSVDVVSVGQALHWFADEVSLAELHRVLRPGSGRLVLAWNSRDALSTAGVGGWPDHSLEAMVRAAAQPGEGPDRPALGGGAGEPEADADRACLPAALEAAIEAFYTPSVPRQQSGRWRRQFLGPEQSSLLHLPSPAAASGQGGGGSVRGAFSPDLLQRHGAFGRFPSSALQRGARMLERAAAARTAAAASGTGSSSDVAAVLAAGAMQARVRAASADDSEGPCEALAPTSTPKPLFRITQHLRAWDTVPQTEDEIVSNFCSISVVAAAPAADRDAVAEALRACIAQSAHVEEEGGLRLYAMPFIRDVFVAEPLR